MSQYVTSENSKSFWRKVNTFFTGKEDFEYELMDGSRIYRWVKILRVRKKYIDVRISCLNNKEEKDYIVDDDGNYLGTTERTIESVVIVPPPVQEREVIEIEEFVKRPAVSDHSEYNQPEYNQMETEAFVQEEPAVKEESAVQVEQEPEPVQEEVKEEPKVELEPEVKPEVKDESVEEKEEPAVVVKKVRVKKETPRALIRFPGVTSMRSLYIIAKNSAAGADMAYNNIQEIKTEIEEINKELSKLRTPQGASDAVRAELASRRTDLNQRKKYRQDEVTLTQAKGVNLEIAADEYAYLIKYLNGETVNYRKSPRFNEEIVIKVTDEDLKDLKDYLFD